MKLISFAFFIFMFNTALAQFDIPKPTVTKVGPVAYFCTTSRIFVKELPRVFNTYGLKSNAFAIDVKTSIDAGRIWFLDSITDLKGPMLVIEKGNVLGGRCPHCYNFKPNSLLFESYLFKISQDQIDKSIVLKLIDESTENQANRTVLLEATCHLSSQP